LFPLHTLHSLLCPRKITEAHGPVASPICRVRTEWEEWVWGLVPAPSSHLCSFHTSPHLLATFCSLSLS
jgi:hypothetical protein